MAPAEKRGYAFGRVDAELPSFGSAVRRSKAADSGGTTAALLREIAEGLENGAERTAPHRPRAAGKRLRLRLDHDLTRWRDGSGAAVFELLARALASDKGAPLLAAQLSADSPPLSIVMLDRSRHLVEVDRESGLLGLNRVALRASRISPAACLVAAGIVHGLRAAAGARAGVPYDGGKETLRDVQDLLLLLLGILGTEWDPAEVRRDFEEMLDRREPLLEVFTEYARKLEGSLKRKTVVCLDDRVFRDGALFDRLPGREKLRVIFAGTLAWYGLLTFGLLRLPRRCFARRNPYYETAWWIFRAKPGGRRLFKGALARRSLKRLKSLRILSAVEYLWSAWNPTLAVTCLRPVYRSAGGNHRPFRATMATFTYTALVIHPLWVTLTITGSAWALGHVWPWILTHTRIASRENLILHSIVIGFWIGVGLIVATSKWLRYVRSATSRARRR